MARWRLACDACGAGAWVGPRADGADLWCEACQRAVALEAVPDGTALCPACGAPLSLDTLRFEELYGELQNAAAVVDAWAGDPAALGAILPERPRFLTDLDPPALTAADEGVVRLALQRLHEGHFADARVLLEEALEEKAGTAREWRALAVARERLGDAAMAEEACTRALDHAESAPVRLARGCLRARRGDFQGARADFARAGTTRETRWNLAALRVMDALAHGAGLPDGATLEAARAQAAPQSPYWSEPTVGRLLWGLLVERARAGPGTRATTLETLRAAEAEFEFDTFWDRALVVHGHAVLGHAFDTARVARRLELELHRALLAEPCLAASSAAPIREALARSAAAVAGDDPAAAGVELRALLARDDLRRYRVPCARCGHGTLGVEQLEEGAEPE